jgi:hypothetical protein
MPDDYVPLDAPAVAEEFLKQWQKACASCDGGDPKAFIFLGREFQDRLAKKLAQFTGPVSMGEANAVARELHARAIEPAVEVVLLMLWRHGLRAAEHDAAMRDFISADPPPEDFWDEFPNDGEGELQ